MARTRPPTKAFFEAKCAALEAENEGLKIERDKLRRRVSEYEQATMLDARDRASITNMRQRLQRCKELSAQGVPCRIRAGLLVHSITGAPLE